MRIAFFVVVLAGAMFYSYVAFADLGFLTRTGRLGPGFFPRIIGVGAVAMTLWAISDELRTAGGREGEPGAWRDVVLLIVLSLAYAVLMRLFGGIIATVVFLLAALSLLNRGQPVTNTLVALLVPGGIYLLFDRLLNANMPPGLFDLPI